MVWTDLITPPKWTQPKRCGSCGGTVKYKARYGDYEIHVYPNRQEYRLFHRGMLKSSGKLDTLETSLTNLNLN